MSENRFLSKLISADEVTGSNSAKQLSVHEVLDGASTDTKTQFVTEVEFQEQSHKPTNRERLHALLDVLGYLYMTAGKPERARSYWRLLVSLCPSDSRLLRSLAHSELDSGNADLARELLEKSLLMQMKRRERAATFLLLSRAFLRLQRLEDSAKAIANFMNEKSLLS